MPENADAKVLIRPLRPADERDWRRLWAGYLAFYRQALSAETTETTWRALIEEGRAEMLGRVAELEGRVVGMLNAVIHPNTWSAAPVCYLEDLYVDAERRGLGIDVEVFEIAQRRRRPGVGVDHGVEHAHHAAFELGDPPEHLRTAFLDERAPGRLRGLGAQSLAVEREIPRPQAAPIALVGGPERPNQHFGVGDLGHGPLPARGGGREISRNLVIAQSRLRATSCSWTL